MSGRGKFDWENTGGGKNLLDSSRVLSRDAAALPQGALLDQHRPLLQLPRSGPRVCETGSDPMKKSIVALVRALAPGSSFSPDALLHVHVSDFSFMFLHQTQTPGINKRK